MEKTLLSLPAYSNNRSDGVQPPACLPPCFWSGTSQRLECSPVDQGSVCRGMRRACPFGHDHDVPSCVAAAEGQVPPCGTEMRMLSLPQESGDPPPQHPGLPEERVVIPWHHILLLPACPLHGPSLSTRSGSPDGGAWRRSHGPALGWWHQPSSSMQGLSCMSFTWKMCSSWSLQPG